MDEKKKTRFSLLRSDRVRLALGGALALILASSAWWVRPGVSSEPSDQETVGFEKFDGSLSPSGYVQRVQYVRAVQGELVRTIENLAPVKRARVHISLPPEKGNDSGEPPKASVVLEVREGETLSSAQVNGIAHLVSGAIDGLKVGQVTIVDTRGGFLHRPEEEASASGNLFDTQRRIEAEYEKRIEEILAPVVGFGNVRAEVTAEIDPARTSSTEESYDGDRAVAQSLHRGESEAENTTYAIPKKITTIDKPSGNIRRLTVAVLVDGHYRKNGDSGEEVFVPRPEDELARLREVVANAVGLDPQRRDSLIVSSLPFHAPPVRVPPVERAPAAGSDLSEWWRQSGTTALLLAFGALFIGWGLTRLVRSLAAREELAELGLPRTVGELQAVGPSSGAPGPRRGAARP